VRSYVVAEFPTEETLLVAARTLRGEGHPELDLHTPVPVHGADEALGLERSVVPRIALVLGVLGAVTGYLMQVGMVAIDWPINVGNRPPHSAPAFIPVTFELGVLFSAFGIFFGLFVLWGLPRLHHPVFEVEAFRSASIDGLWLSTAVEAEAAEGVAGELRGLGATLVEIVPEAT
jgi:hypothetical protein